MYNCVECGREHASFRRSDGEALCSECAHKKYEPCKKCGHFIDPDYIGADSICDKCAE